MFYVCTNYKTITCFCIMQYTSDPCMLLKFHLILQVALCSFFMTLYVHCHIIIKIFVLFS